MFKKNKLVNNPHIATQTSFFRVRTYECVSLLNKGILHFFPKRALDPFFYLKIKRLLLNVYTSLDLD